MKPEPEQKTGFTLGVILGATLGTAATLLAIRPSKKSSSPGEWLSEVEDTLNHVAAKYPKETDTVKSLASHLWHQVTEVTESVVKRPKKKTTPKTFHKS